MGTEKKINLNDCAIQIRILKAIEKQKLFGPFKHFKMISLLRGLKQPNILTSSAIWKYLEEEFDVLQYETAEHEKVKECQCYFNDIFDD